jgi:hypothetical protein
MQMGKNQASQRPTAFGSMLQAATYGMAIPQIYGRTQSPLLAIWAANLRQGGSTKKFKQMKKGITSYVENIDFLVGHNPVMGMLQLWNNAAPIPLNFVEATFTAGAGRGSYTVPDSHFYAVIGVTLVQPYSATFNDYGSTGGPQTLSGTYEVPLWNEIMGGPDPTHPMSYRCWPFCYRWVPSYGATVYVDAEAFPGGTLKVYYAQLKAATSYLPPLQKMRLAFEPKLGSGSEYADAGLSSEQIIYPQFAGVGSSDIDLGSTGTIPSLRAEVQGKFGVYPTGDGDFMDMVEDLVKSGIAQAAIGSQPAMTQLEHGLSSYSLPGCIQKKVDSSTSAALPPMLYDMPCTVGNILVCQVAAAGTLAISSTGNELWTPALSDNTGYQVWTATAAGGPTTVTVSGAGAGAWNMALYEIAGAAAIDSVFAGSYTGQAAMGIAKIGSSPLTGLAVSTTVGKFVSYTLPDDAVVQAIYPVANLAGGMYNGNGYAVYGKNLDFLYDGGFSGDFAGFPGFNGSASSFNYQAVGHNLGTDLSVLNQLMMGISTANSAAYGQQCWAFGGLYPSPNEDTVGAACGCAIYYTSETPHQDTFMEPPYPVPPGQGLAWALPCSFVLYWPDPFVRSAPNNDLNNCALAQTWKDAFVNATIVTPGGIPFTIDTSNNVGQTLQVDMSNGPGGSVQSTVTKGFDGYLMALPFYADGAPDSMEIQQWEYLTPDNFYAQNPSMIRAHGRVVRNPGNYSISIPGTPTQMVMLSLKSTGPRGVPMPRGDFMDKSSMDLVRMQCRANGLWGSLSMNAQKAASDWLKDLYAAANAAPVFMGFKLYSFPYSEVSAVGNGAVYNAPTASGPVADLSADNGDFISNPPITAPRNARVDSPNVFQMQHINRNSNYNQVVTVQPESSAIALYGVRKQDPVTNLAIQDVAVARSLLGIVAKRSAYAPQTYKFTLNSKWQLLAPMTLVTITDTQAGIFKVPVRLTSIEEDDKYQLQAEAEPFIYGMCAPGALPATAPAPYVPNPQADPGSINAPIIFEPVQRLYGGSSATAAELWLVVSGASPNYGGCQVFISTDGGNSYNAAPAPGVITGNAITGVTAADWPAAADPDTANNLEVDLTESLGTLESYQLSDENAFTYPCYVAGGGSSPIPYELVTYAIATLTAANEYTLQATGTGNQLRRAVFGAPAVGTGVDHPSGSRFAFLNPSGLGILKLAMDATWVGKTLYFKFIPINTFGVATQTLSDATAYGYTPSGIGVSGASYTQTPSVALSQPSATQIDMAQVTEQFAANSANYNARTFPIPDPGGTPTLYYVTIADPNYLGDTGSETNLTGYCETSAAKVGQPGFIYVGSILCTHDAGTTASPTPGGWPQQSSYQSGE